MTTGIDYTDKIEKLLRKAASTDAEAEAEALRERAYAIMAERDISMADVEARRRAAGERVNEPIIEKAMKITGIFRYGLNTLSFQIIDALENVGVRAYYINDTYALVEQANGKEKFKEAIDFVVVGRKSDVEQTIMLLTSLQMQAAAAMTLWWQTNPDRDYMARGLAFRSRRSFIISFGTGAAQKIRLAQRRSRATVASSGAELVLRDKNAEVDAFMEMKGLRTVKDRNQAGLLSASDSGYAAGQRANTGDAAVGKTDRRQIT